nr:Ig-like domain-containing protein [Persicitalea jodogahamensis]
MATRNGDTYRFLASADNTTITVNGVNETTLNRGQFFEKIYTNPINIVASQPILVAQYSNGQNFDNVNADPFMLLIPPYEQFLGGYTVTTPSSGFVNNYVNVLAPNAAVGTIKLDGITIPAGSFTAIGSTGFSGAAIPVSIGTHNLTGSGLPFGITVYGFNNVDSYGYLGGASFAPIATVSSLVLNPKTSTATVGTEKCVTALVKDQNGNPVSGVRVDFTISGPNASNSGFANTAANGLATFCYTGTNAGTDNLVAAVGTLTDNGNISWNAGGTPVERCGPQNKYYTICYYGVTQCVSEKIAERYLKLGATMGACGSGNARIGVEETALASPFELSVKGYPNPTQGVLTVEVISRITGPAQMQVLDLAGRPVQQRSEQLLEGLNEVKFDLTAQPSGTYLIRATDGQNRQGVIRVSKQ